MTDKTELNPTDEQIERATQEWIDGGKKKDLVTMIIDRVLIDQMIAMFGKKDGS